MTRFNVGDRVARHSAITNERMYVATVAEVVHREPMYRLRKDDGTVTTDPVPARSLVIVRRASNDDAGVTLIGRLLDAVNAILEHPSPDTARALRGAADGVAAWRAATVEASRQATDDLKRTNGGGR